MRLEHLNHLVELLISPIRAQLAYAALTSRLTDADLVFRLGGHGYLWVATTDC